MLPADEPVSATSPSNGSWTEVLITFLRLGCFSFGGPIAYIGYLQAECVERRRWCTNQAFAEIVALAQSLPGPASSQVASTLGLVLARLPGAFAAWASFTLPSALLMLAFAYGDTLLTGSRGSTIPHGLQIVAVAIVAQSVLIMQCSLAPDRARIIIALPATTITLFVPASLATLTAIFIGAVFGTLLPASSPATRALFSISRHTGLSAPRSSSLCSRCLRSLPAGFMRNRYPSSTLSIALALWSSVEVTSSSRCSNALSLPPAGSTKPLSSAAMVPRRPFWAHSLPSPPTSVLSSIHPVARCCSRQRP